MKFHLTTRSKLYPLLLFGLGLSASGNAETFDFEFQAGQTEVATRKFQELDKRGYALGASVLKRISLPPIGDLAFGLGAFATKVEGKKSSQGITQDLDTTLLSLDVRYLYEACPNLGVGPLLRAYFGRGAKFGVQNNDDVDFQFAPGIMMRYAFPSLAYEPAITLHYSHDANIAKRNVQTVLLGVGVTIGFGEEAKPVGRGPIPQADGSAVRDSSISSPMVDGEDDASATHAIQPIKGDVLPSPDAAATDQKKSEEPAKPALATLVFNFAPNSTRLNGISRERAKALAKLLVEHPKDYSSILITGHSDKSGDPGKNIELSRRRTEAFCELLTGRGVPRGRMRCEPKDFQALLPGLPDNAEEHRRIEVTFEGLTQAQIETWQEYLKKALQL